MKKKENDLQSIPGGEFPLTLNQMIGIAGVCVSAGLYLQREQLMGYFKPKTPQPQPQSPPKTKIPIPVKTNNIPQMD